MFEISEAMEKKEIQAFVALDNWSQHTFTISIPSPSSSNIIITTADPGKKSDWVEITSNIAYITRTNRSKPTLSAHFLATSFFRPTAKLYEDLSDSRAVFYLSEHSKIVKAQQKDRKSPTTVNLYYLSKDVNIKKIYYLLTLHQPAAPNFSTVQKIDFFYDQPS
jgi:hypothetical protein